MPDSKSIHLLVVDEEADIRELCCSVGSSLGLCCTQAATAEEALQRVKTDPPEMMLADLVMGKTGGLELLAAIKRRWPRTEVALMSAHGSIESAVEAMRLGAYDFIVKPVPLEKMSLILQGMAEKVLAAQQERSPRDDLRGTTLNPCTDLEELEKLTVQRVFELVNGDKAEAQKLLGISRATLYRKIKRYGIETRRNGKNVHKKVVRGGQERVILLSQS